MILLVAALSVALTFDDLPAGQVNGCDVAAFERLNRDLVGSLRRNRIPAMGFVNAGRCRGADSTFAIWSSNGLELGNHTASHLDLNKVPLDVYERDLLAGEIEHVGKWFRYPMLHTGGDAQKKSAFESFLREHGYTNVPVTIDDDDYLFAIAYRDAMAARDMPLARAIADEYIRYMDSVFAFYEKFSRDTLGYNPPQIVLLHANRLNADHMDRLVAMIRKRGYTFISVEEAMKDPAYRHADRYTGPYGLSWMHRWAKTDGKPAPNQPEANIPTHQ
jgi:peptidoglycan-N-acetylglucosamine deacetylase